MSLRLHALSTSQWCRYYGGWVFSSRRRGLCITSCSLRQLKGPRPRVSSNRHTPSYQEWSAGTRSLTERGWSFRHSQEASGFQSSLHKGGQRCCFHFTILSGADSRRFQRRTTVGQARDTATMADTARQSQDLKPLSYLSQEDAIAVDEFLMGPLGFSVDQLMELAGLSVACAIAEVYGVTNHTRILVIAGPGNNGGDGLVAARHLHHFGYKISLCYPKRTNKPLYHGLVTQLESLSIQFLSAEELPGRLADAFDVVVDAMFGFSFKGKPRPPFDTFLERLAVPTGSKAADLGVPALVSIDIPSGWHVEDGDVDGGGLSPDMLVSLTAPKICAKNFKGAHHFLGGRFVPPAVAAKFGLQLPQYPGSAQCVRIGKLASVELADLRENYAGFELLEEQAKDDPLEQFQIWFDDAVTAKMQEPNAMTLATADARGRPSARTVLLKGFDERGFVWYTNYGSRKGTELKENPHASLVFFWDRLHRSVRIEGSVQRVSDEESEKYFHVRPRGSQLGALVSKQSTVIESRDILDEKYKELLGKFPEGVVIPKPDYWGGFRLHPTAIEFWQGGTSRLHDRLKYTRANENGNQPSWVVERLSP